MMSTHPALSQRLARLRSDESGVSAVEFALLLPLMLMLYLGTAEVSLGIGVDRKVTLTSRTVADLASQVSSISSADMSNILGAASSVIAPHRNGVQRRDRVAADRLLRFDNHDERDK